MPAHVKFCGDCGAPMEPAGVTTLIAMPRPRMGDRVITAAAVPAFAGLPAIPAGSSGLVLAVDEGSNGPVYDIEVVVDGVSLTRQIDDSVLRSGLPTVARVPEQAVGEPDRHVDAPSSAGAPVAAAEKPDAAGPTAPAPVQGPPAAPSSRPVPAPQPLLTSGFKGTAARWPLMFYRLFFSPRRPLVVRTTLTVDRVHQLFAEQLVGSSKIKKLASMMSSYGRNVRWSVHRPSTHESTATCVPKGPVAWGAGRMKRLYDLSGDRIAVTTSVQSDGATVASLGPAVWSTAYGLFAFPQMLAYAHLPLKAWREADPQLLVAYPLSRSRVAGWVLLVVAALAILAA